MMSSGRDVDEEPAAIEDRIARRGFALVSGAVDATHIDCLVSDFEAAMVQRTTDAAAIQSRDGVVNHTSADGSETRDTSFQNCSVL